MLWLLSADPRLPTSVVSLLQEAGQEVFVSQASLWEMAIKTSLGRLQTVGSMQRVDGHRGPFDRLLVAQSRCEPLLLLSADHQLAAYGATVRLV